MSTVETVEVGERSRLEEDFARVLSEVCLTRRDEVAEDPLAAGMIFDWTERGLSPNLVFRALAAAKRADSPASVVLVRAIWAQTECVMALRRPGAWLVDFGRVREADGVISVAESGKAAFFRDWRSAVAAVPYAVTGRRS